MKHDLKIDKQEFDERELGRKTFEIRFDDRNYQIGDLLHLRETLNTGAQMRAGAPLEYTGREDYMKIRHILRGPRHGLIAGWVILS